MKLALDLRECGKVTWELPPELAAKKVVQLNGGSCYTEAITPSTYAYLATLIASMAPPENRYRARGGRLRLLVMGGSQGARVLNTTMPDALALVPEDTRPRVLHQAGAAHLESVRRRYEERGVAAEVADFIEDIASRYAEADLIICRAGATTVAEIAAAGIASLLVPYPHAVDDHQMVNARFLADRGAALLIPQSEFTPQRLAEVLAGTTRDGLLAMAQRARAVGKPEATLAVAKVCMELAA